MWENSEERLPQRLCYSPGVETGGLGSRGTKEEGKIYRQCTFLPPRIGLWVRRESLLELGAGVQQQGERRMLGGEGLWDPRRCQQSGKEDVAGDLLQR